MFQLTMVIETRDVCQKIVLSDPKVVKHSVLNSAHMGYSE